MTGFSSFFVAALTGVLGLIVTGIVGNALNDWFHFYPNREMNAGLMTIFMSAAGGIAFFIFGFVVSSIVAGRPEPTFLKAAGISCGTVLGLGAVVLLGGWLRADTPPRIDGEEIELAVELRTPAGFSLPVKPDETDTIAGVRPVGGTVRLHGPLNLKRAKQVDGRWNITAQAPLLTSAKRKEMVVRLGKGINLTFQLPLRAHPDRGDMEWSPWIAADPVAGEAEATPGKKFSARYRVKSARRTHAEIEAEKAEEEQARFDALGADTPLEEWLTHARPGLPEAHIAAAVKRIVARPNHAAEFAALMVGNDDVAAIMALEFVPLLPAPQPALLPHVAAAGRDIARRIREVNAGAKAGEDYPSGGDSAAHRFTAWMQAVRVLREKSGGDFTLELGEILTRSRERPETALLQEHVRAVASRTMKEWANVEPLPGDLPTR